MKWERARGNETAAPVSGADRTRMLKDAMEWIAANPSAPFYFVHTGDFIAAAFRCGDELECYGAIVTDNLYAQEKKPKKRRTGAKKG